MRWLRYLLCRMLLKKSTCIRMVKKYLAFLLLAVVCVSFVSAIDTTIDVKTLPDYDVQVAASKANTVAFELLTPSILKAKSDANGSVSFLLSFDDAKYNLDVNIKKDNVTVNKTRLSNLVAGENVYLDFVPEWAKALETPKANLTEINSTLSNESLIANESLDVLLENQTDNNTNGNWISSTGLFIFEKGKSIFTSNITYYVVAILVIGLFAFVVRRKFAGPKVAREIKVKKLSELHAERDEEKKKSDDLKEAEERLREAQAKVSKLKNTDKARELEDKIRKEQEELKRLKNSDD